MYGNGFVKQTTPVTTPREKSYCMEDSKQHRNAASKTSSPRISTLSIVCRCQGCQERHGSWMETGWNPSLTCKRVRARSASIVGIGPSWSGMQIKNANKKSGKIEKAVVFLHHKVFQVYIKVLRITLVKIYELIFPNLYNPVISLFALNVLRKQVVGETLYFTSLLLSASRIIYS